MRRSAQQLAAGLAAWVVCASSAAASVVAPQPYESAAWVIESADYAGRVADQIVRFEVRLSVHVLQDGWVEVPLTFPGATVTAIALERETQAAHILPRGGAYVLGASKRGAYRVRIACAVRLAQDSQFEGIQLGIPRATFSTVTVAVPRGDLELRPDDQLYVERRAGGSRGGVTLVARLGAADRIDVRWRTRPAQPTVVEPVLYGEVQTLLTVEEQVVRWASIIDYRIAQGEVKALMIALPGGLNVLNVRGAGIEDWRVDEASGRRTLAIALATPLKDTTYRLVMEGEQTLDGQAATYDVPAIRLVDIKQERGYIGLARIGSTELASQEAEGVSRIDVRELPEGLQVASANPVVLAFKYHQHPYRALVRLTRHEDHPVLAAIAEQAHLATIVSQQGELLTRAAYLIKANKKQFLEVALPPDAELWSCLVAQRSVKPVAGAQGRLLIPLDAAIDAGGTTVELVYFERRPALTRLGQLRLRGPVLDVPATIANWTVYAPHDVPFLRVSGNLDRGISPAQFIDDSFPVRVASASDLREPKPGYQNEANRQGNKDDGFDKMVRSVMSRTKRASVAQEGAYNMMADAASPSSGEERDAVEPAGYPIPPAGSESSASGEQLEAWMGERGEAGILPLKIRLPKSGRTYAFSRLMTSQDALALEATFVHVRLPWAPFGLLATVLLPVGGLAWFRFGRI